VAVADLLQVTLLTADTKLSGAPGVRFAIEVLR
jgi:predicted nucleic acid-binding protein